MVQTKTLHRLGSVVKGVNPSVLLFVAAIIAIILRIATEGYVFYDP